MPTEAIDNRVKKAESLPAALAGDTNHLDKTGKGKVFEAVILPDKRPTAAVIQGAPVVQKRPVESRSQLNECLHGQLPSLGGTSSCAGVS